MIRIFGLRCIHASAWRATFLTAGIVGLSSGAGATSIQRGMTVGAVVVAPCDVDRVDVRCVRGEHYNIDIELERARAMNVYGSATAPASDEHQRILVREVIF